ncbi:MAG: ABC transporter ATP-binding protein [Beijerinckiaceae bacterium]
MQEIQSFTRPGEAEIARPLALAFDHVSKHFIRADGTSFEAVSQISFDVPGRTVTALLGPSGCGKSTLLNMAAGLIPPDAGSIFVLGKTLSGSIDWSQVSYMFQDDRLLPWRTALANVALALEAGSMHASERRRRAHEGLALVGLPDFSDAYPHQLSGGMRSRVALARSMVTGPDLLLMDEPFSRLDAQTRMAMHEEVLRLQRLRQMSVLLVTHDVEEAVILANQIVVMSPRPGRVQRIVEVRVPHPRLGTEEAMELVRSLRGLLADGTAGAAELETIGED